MRTELTHQSNLEQCLTRQFINLRSNYWQALQCSGLNSPRSRTKNKDSSVNLCRRSSQERLVGEGDSQRRGFLQPVMLWLLEHDPAGTLGNDETQACRPSPRGWGIGYLYTYLHRWLAEGCSHGAFVNLVRPVCLAHRSGLW